MPLDTVSALAAQALPLSLATERIVTSIKTVVPSWFAEPENAHLTLLKDPWTDKWRRFRVQLIAYAASYAGATVMAGSGFFAGDARIALGPGTGEGIPVWIFAFLATGGSAFWTNMLSITSTLKDLRLQQRTANAAQVNRSTADQRADAITGRTVAPALVGLP